MTTATAAKLIAIGIIVVSFLIGLASYYLFNDGDKELKKKQAEEIISQLVNLVVYIWIAKIILNLAVFVQDPLAILAYPSNSSAFYLAFLFSVGTLLYKFKRKKLDHTVFLESFLHVFLVASFVYEFVQLVWNDNTYALGYLILLTCLLVLFILIRGRLATSTFILVIVLGWSVGLFLISQVQAFVTVFGYMMAPWFSGGILLTSTIILIYTIRTTK